MKIYGLRAENVKRLKLVEITPEGNVIKITGKNGNGKSSVLDAICLALGGDAAVKLTNTTRPIHGGEKHASVTVNLGDYIVTRTWSADDKTTLKVENADGKKISSPQTLLNSFLGNLSFDPLAFLQMTSTDKLKTLHRIIGFDPAPLEARRKELFDQRTDVNRDIRNLQAKLKDMNTYAGVDLPAAEVNPADLVAEFQVAADMIAENNKKREQLDRLRDNNKRLISEIDSVESQIAALTERKKELVASREIVLADGGALSAEVKALVDPDLPAIRERMKTVEDTNRQVRERETWRQLDLTLVARTETAEKLTEDIEAVDAEKAATLKDAALPVAGLGFDEEGVTFKDMPLDQASHSEKIQVSMAMGMKLNPELRVMFIKDGEKFDSDAWKIVEKMAIDNDYQLFVELVQNEAGVGVYIEDGVVKEKAVAQVDESF